MHALLVVAHPSPDSFSHALAHAAREVLVERRIAVDWHDLYAEGFDPVQRTGEAGNTGSSDALVERHCAELARAGLVVVCHPNWWGQPPAILKGWIDRVFRLGMAYGYPPGVPPEGVPTGLLTAREALVFNTSNTPPDREAEAFGDPLDTLWRRCVFALCGIQRVTRRTAGPMSGSSAQARAAWLAEARALGARAADEARAAA
jgi:putative NADPH-quinone reductase